MKNTKKDIQARLEAVEKWLCKEYGLTSNSYVEMWYEWGCQYAESMFDRMKVPIEHKEDGVRLFIVSQIFWYHWSMEWLQTAEAFIDWSWKHKTLSHLRKMQVQGSSRRAWPLIHELIVEQHNARL